MEERAKKDRKQVRTFEEGQEQNTDLAFETWGGGVLRRYNIFFYEEEKSTFLNEMRSRLKGVQFTE